MSDHTQVGVPVWIGPNGGALVNPTPHYDPTHLAIPLDAASLAGLRERVCKALNDMLDDEDAVDATFAAFAALGLDPS